MAKTEKKAAGITAEQSLFNAFSLCRKAGKLVRGFDAVVDSVFNGTANSVFFASDVSEKTAERIKETLQEDAAYYLLPLSGEELLPICGKKSVVFSVTDGNLAKLCIQKWMQCNDKKEEVGE